MLSRLKSLSANLLILSLLCSSASATSLSQEKKEETKQELTRVLNQMQGMSDHQYTDLLTQASDEARDRGEMEQAQIFDALAKDPESKDEISQQLYEKIQSESENGILLAYSLITGRSILRCRSQNYTGCAFLGIVLIIATLEGEEARNY